MAKRTAAAIIRELALLKGAPITEDQRRVLMEQLKQELSVCIQEAADAAAAAAKQQSLPGVKK